jgi:hypothetical protein
VINTPSIGSSKDNEADDNADMKNSDSKTKTVCSSTGIADEETSDHSDD